MRRFPGVRKLALYGSLSYNENTRRMVRCGNKKKGKTMKRSEYLNGGNVDAAIDALVRAAAACEEARRLLATDGAPHPRDYVKGMEDDGYRDDRVEWDAALSALSGVREYCESESHALFDWSVRHTLPRYYARPESQHDPRNDFHGEVKP